MAAVYFFACSVFLVNFTSQFTISSVPVRIAIDDILSLSKVLSHEFAGRPVGQLKPDQLPRGQLTPGPRGVRDARVAPRALETGVARAGAARAMITLDLH